MKLLGARILVTDVEGAEKTSGGIFLPQSLRDENNVGGPKVYRVLDVGPGARDKQGNYIPLDVKPGDRVICHSYTTGPISLEDKRKIVSIDQVLMVVDGELPAPAAEVASNLIPMYPPFSPPSV